MVRILKTHIYIGKSANKLLTGSKIDVAWNSIVVDKTTITR